MKQARLATTTVTIAGAARLLALGAAFGLALQGAFAQTQQPPAAAAAKPAPPLKLSADEVLPKAEPPPPPPPPTPYRQTLEEIIVRGRRDPLVESDRRLAATIARLPTIGTDSPPTDSGFDEVMDYITRPGDINTLPQEQQQFIRSTQPMSNGQPGAPPVP